MLRRASMIGRRTTEVDTARDLDITEAMPPDRHPLPMLMRMVIPIRITRITHIGDLLLRFTQARDSGGADAGTAVHIVDTADGAGADSWAAGRSRVTGPSAADASAVAVTWAGAARLMAEAVADTDKF